MGQTWGTDSQGGFLTTPELSRKIREAAQPMCRFRQFVRPEEDFGRNMGDRLEFTKTSDIAVQGRKISELETVPTSNITIFKDAVTADEYSNSVEYTWKLEILAKLDINSPVISALKNDMAKVLDKAASIEFKATDLVYCPQGTETNKSYTLSTTGATNVATRNMSIWDVKNLIDLMKSTYKMPKFDGNNFMSVCTTTHMRGLKDDSEYFDAVKYGDPDRFFTGELGRYYGCRFTEETNALNGNKAGGLGEAVYFGEDAVIEIAVYPEELQAKLGEDYGRNRGIRWVWVGGFKRTWDYSTEGDARAVFVTST